jgi:hypothetical protein
MHAAEEQDNRNFAKARLATEAMKIVGHAQLTLRSRLNCHRQKNKDEQSAY